MLQLSMLALHLLPVVHFLLLPESAHWNEFIYSMNLMEYFALLYYVVTFFALKL